MRVDKQEVLDKLRVIEKEVQGLISALEGPPTQDGVYELWTDGSSIGHRGPGGWSFVIVENDALAGSHYGYQANTTNNEMEMVGILRGLQALEDKADVEVCTDSKLCIGWLDWGYKCNKSHIVRVRDKIRETIQTKELEVTYRHVHGHNGHKWNEMADELAKRGRHEGR
jgi:ribonuclease HI